MGLKVAADQTRCVSSGQCAATVPEVFDQRDEDGVVQLLQTDPPDVLHGAVHEAVALCPVSALAAREVERTA